MIAYKITHTTSGRGYIGITSRSLRARWRGHCAKQSESRYLSRAIQKYGPDAFSVIVLAHAVSWEELLVLERALIAEHGTMKPNGFNLTAGGEGMLGFRHTSLTRAKIGAAHRGKTISAKQRAQISAARRGVPMFAQRGKPRSEETREKISQAKLGVKLSVEHRANIRAAMRGIPRPWQVGVPRSSEIRAKISATKLAQRLTLDLT